MTEKKEKIWRAALELFAEDGFKATSTSKIAKRAEVSEGLIFRHFGNKEGLLDAILNEGEEKAKVLFSEVVFESDPAEVLRKTFNIMQQVVENKADAGFWKLQYKIKWETEQYGEHKIEPLKLALVNALAKLGYDDPEKEADLILVLFDGIATRFSLSKNFNIHETVSFLKKKYKV